jgi:hypothetical protein
MSHKGSVWHAHFTDEETGAQVRQPAQSQAANTRPLTVSVSTHSTLTTTLPGKANVPNTGKETEAVNSSHTGKVTQPRGGSRIGTWALALSSTPPPYPILLPCSLITASFPKCFSNPSAPTAPWSQCPLTDHWPPPVLMAWPSTQETLEKSHKESPSWEEAKCPVGSCDRGHSEQDRRV